MWFQKVSIPTPWKVIGISKGEGVLDSQIITTAVKYEHKLEIPEGGKVQMKKTFYEGGTDFFWNHTM